MLYSLYEAQHLAVAPLRYMAEWSRGWFGNPFSPFAHLPISRRMAASSDLFLRVTDRYEKPQWHLEDVEIEVAQEKPFCRLIHFKQGVPPKYPGYMRRVYPGFLQHLGFVAMNPDRHVNAHWDYFNHLMVGDGESAEAHRRFYDEYNAVLDLPAEYYLDTVKAVFQDFALPKGRMFVRDELVRPHVIRDAALLTIEGELDDISGNGQTEAAHALCLNIPRERRAHFLAPGVGHYGIFSGRRWREAVVPRVREFISTYSS